MLSPPAIHGPSPPAKPKPTIALLDLPTLRILPKRINLTLRELSLEVRQVQVVFDLWEEWRVD